MTYFIAFMACLGIIYFYVEKRGSFGFFWAGFFIAIMYLAESYTSFPETFATVITAAATLISYEISRYLWDDPFSEASVYQFLRRVLRFIKALCFAIGLKPKNTLTDFHKDKQVQGVRKMLLSRNFQRAEQLLLKQDANTRHFTLECLASRGGRPKYINEWAETMPDSYLARTLSGLNWIELGWEARGSGLGDTVSASAARTFYERLALAEEDLTLAVEQCKHEPDAYVGLITIAMGTGPNLWQYFASALRDHPCHYYAHRQMIQACAEKWGGDAGEMFSVARKATREAAPGDPLNGAIALAHIEQWLYLQMLGLEGEAADYFYSPEIQHELCDAYRAYGDAPVLTPESIEVFNYFVYSFYLGGLYEEHAEALARLQGRYTEMPWSYHEGSFLCLVDTGFAIDQVLNTG